MSGDVGRTVVAPPPGGGRGEGGDRFAGLARPLVELAAAAARDRAPDAEAIAAEARRRTEAMEAAGLRAGIEPADLAAARDGLWAMLSVRVALNPAMSRRAWRRASRRLLPGSEALTLAVLRARLAAAEAAGAPKRDLARLIRHCVQAVAEAPPAAEPARRWAIAVAGVFALLLAWGGWSEWRFATGVVATLPVAPALPPDAPVATVTAALDRLAGGVALAATEGARAPLGLVPHLGRHSPEGIAEARYRAAADATLPPRLAERIATVLAEEGGSLALYDTLRALAILDGDAPWEPDFLAGWLEQHGGGSAPAALAPHVAALSGPAPGLPAQDDALLAQARAIAGEGDRTAFAALELVRSTPMRALPALSLTEAVPGIEGVVVRRSGQPLDRAVPGWLTAEGWRLAAGGEAERAIVRMQSESQRLLPPSRVAVTPEAVLAVLQQQTLAAWSALLGDLRVRPFADQPTALAVSGALSRRTSPLEELLRLAWTEAGGSDRSRSHADQLRVAATLGPTIAFVEGGGLGEIGRLFATLNVVIAGLGADAEVGRRQLMDVQARLASVETLNRAPRLVVQIVEDVLAQTAATQAAGYRPAAAQRWADEGAPACLAALAGGYPFAAGPDADLAAAAGFLGPDGTLAQLVATEFAPLLDRDSSPWSWLPEARLSGFSPESAAFLERALAVGDGLFPPGGTTMTLAALAQRGAATVTLGGRAASVTTSSDSAALAWPGPDPAAGFAISFATGAGADDRAWPGPWGLLHMLDSVRLRMRDGGQRLLLDVRVAASRAFMEMSFDRPANPASVRGAAAGLACPDAL